jgi:hypothetical protein
MKMNEVDAFSKRNTEYFGFGYSIVYVLGENQDKIKVYRMGYLL